MNEQQRVFLEQLAGRIPRLFEAIAAGNVRAEFIVGLRRVGRRNVRLKLVAEVVDPGANPLGTHGAMPGRIPVSAVVQRREGLRVETPNAAGEQDPRERKRRAQAVRNSDVLPDTTSDA